MTGKRQDRIMKDSDNLIDLVYSDFDILNENIIDRREKIRSVFNRYKVIISVLNSKHDMNLSEIDNLQDELDIFSQEYIYLFSSKKITNYMHLCLSGHIRFWLKKVKNLSRFSNANLEAYVGFMRCFFSGELIKVAERL
jgi:hypothetical protein